VHPNRGSATDREHSILNPTGDRRMCDTSADDAPPSFAVHRDSRSSARARPRLRQQIADQCGRSAAARLGRSGGAWPPPPARSICAAVYQAVLSLYDALDSATGKVVWRECRKIRSLNSWNSNDLGHLGRFRKRASRTA
jgi:hypothetical protein